MSIIFTQKYGNRTSMMREIDNYLNELAWEDFLVEYENIFGVDLPSGLGE